MNVKNVSLFVLLVFTSSLFSCKSHFYESKISFDDGNWDENELAEFEVNIEEPNSKYNLFISFENLKKFQTNNLWIFFRIESPTSNIQTDTIEFYISDAKGKWFGNTSGKTVSNLFLYKSNISFPEKGLYNVILQQGMREKDTPLAKSVGIVIDKLN